jgi:hypothetical protein
MKAFNAKAAGWAGIVAGAGLMVEAALWAASGWTPATFADPSTALRFLQTNGDTLRLAVFAGFVNLVFAVVLIAGLADRLRPGTPTRAAATLWFGMVGIGGHALVPLAYWYGTPAFVSADQAAALGSWTGFAAMVGAAGGVGSLFLGLSMAVAGWAAIAHRALPAAPVVFGWVAVLAGGATVLTVFAPSTPLSGVAGAVYMPSLLLAITFRIWAGVALTRAPDHRSREASIASGQPLPS